LPPLFLELLGADAVLLQHDVDLVGVFFTQIVLQAQ
jgi:hypothetical protein